VSRRGVLTVTEQELFLVFSPTADDTTKIVNPVHEIWVLEDNALVPFGNIFD